MSLLSGKILFGNHGYHRRLPHWWRGRGSLSAVYRCKLFSAILWPVRRYWASVREPVWELLLWCFFRAVWGGVALSKLGFMGEIALTIAAIAGSLSIMALIVFVSQKVRGNVTLLIIGVMIGYIANAVIGVLKFFSVEEDIRAYVIWGWEVLPVYREIR